ncbi:ABC transporter permease [Enterococcus sp. AZ072]|uniref:ABC transporter permease n=1 Tax=unclassified Enterococcus TaxID=2608891 RepID=UPI003D28CFBF
MFNTLIWRNTKRSAKDYMIYVGTMTIISSLMFAFHGMIFSKDMRALYADMTVFGVMIGTASFFIIGIVMWLVRYIVNFMLEKRSKEFGTYLLLGMTKKEIIKLFRRENYLLGFLSIILGIIPGYLFQLLFVNIFYSILDAEYKISPDFNPWYLLLTFGIQALAYLLAMKNVRRKIKKMSIRQLLHADQQNEKIVHEKNTRKGILVFLSLIYICVFNVLILTSNMPLNSSVFYSLGLVLAIYLLYFGLSAFFIRFIQKKSPLIYKQDTLFVLRQLSSKIKTMRVTMGTLTILFTGALLTWMVVMMFADYQQNQVTLEQPFDISIANSDPNYAFTKERATIEKKASIKELYQYQIYRDGTTTMNDYLYQHVDGTQKGEKIDGRWTDGTYFGEDTFMRLSDYNHLRKQAGYSQVRLKSGNYILHGKRRLEKQWQLVKEAVTVTANHKTLSLQDTNMEPFAQNGMNGADYILVVPDQVADQMTPYYGVLIANLTDEAPANLQKNLETLDKNFIETDQYGDLYAMGYGNGSDQILTMSGTTIVRDNIKKEASFVIVSICFMLAYLGIVFLCAALTILAVQQLSDSTKHKKRYDILRQLGLNKKETEKVVLKQLSIYYLCPLLISIILSIFIGMFAGERFVYYTGVQGTPVRFYGLALLVFLIIYLAYFLVTYIGFTRNIEKHR